jgi:chromosome partitioning protein
MLGKRVLLLDLDPQAHSTLGVGHDPESLNKTLFDVFTNAHVPMSRVVVSTNVPGLNLVPNNILLSGVEFELASRRGREYTLREQLSSVSNRHDICVIDCSPSLSLLTLNALVASTDVIIPVQAHYYALEGLRQLFETVAIVKERFNSGLEVLGVLLTFVESRTTLSKQVERQMREFFGDLVFKTVIHRTVRLAEAPSSGESVLTYAPESKGAAEYKALADEIIYGRSSSKEEISAEGEEVSEACAEKIIEQIISGGSSSEEPSDNTASVEEVNEGEHSAEGPTEGEGPVEERKDDEVSVKAASDWKTSDEEADKDEVSAEEMNDDQA